MGRGSRWEYFRAIFFRYREAFGKQKGRILEEFCRVCGYNRKYAIRKLNGAPPGVKPERKRRRSRHKYGSRAISILQEVWEAAGYPLVGAVEGDAAFMVASDSGAFPSADRGGEAASLHQCPADGSTAQRQEAASEEAPLRADQARNASEASHPDS